MLTKPYGKTGKDVTVISCGGMRFDKFETPEEIEKAAELVHYAYEKGINYFDTAPFYCNDKSEEIFGLAFKQMKPGTFYTSTKSSQADAGKLRESLEKSLKRLNADKITFYHIWCVVTLDAWKERLAGGAVAEALKAKEEGLIEHVVISSHLRGNELSDVLSEGYFEGVTLGYSALNFPYREKALATAHDMGLGVVTMNPLAGGLIPNNAERFDFLRGPQDASVVEAALRFNISNQAITSALVGFSSKDHVDQAVAAAENFTPYPAEKVEKIRGQILETFDGLCTGCGYCLPCPEDVNIPHLMEAYNHKILSDDGDDQAIVNRLKWHWNAKPEAAAACSLCGACEEKCTQHLPIRERMKAILALDKQED